MLSILLHLVMQKVRARAAPWIPSSFAGPLLKHPPVVQAQGRQLPSPGAAGVQTDDPVLPPEAQGGPVAEHQPHVGALAAGRGVPGRTPLRRLAGRTAELGAHPPLGIDRAQPREGGQSGPRPLEAFEPAPPALGRLLVDGADELGRPVAPQALLHLPGQTLGLLHGPGRKEPGVHESIAVLPMKQRTAAEPLQEIVAVRRGEELAERVAPLLGRHPPAASQEMQVVIAQHDHDPVLLLDGPAEDAERARTAVHQVSDQPEAVLPPVVLNAAQQTLKCVVTAVNVPDRVRRHARNDLAADTPGATPGRSRAYTLGEANRNRRSKWHKRWTES